MAEKTVEKVKKSVEKVPLTLPLLEDPNAPTEEYYSLNFVGYTIQRGVTVMVPPALKEIIDNQEAEKRNAIRYAREVSLKEPTPMSI